MVCEGAPTCRTRGVLAVSDETSGDAGGICDQAVVTAAEDRDREWLGSPEVIVFGGQKFGFGRRRGKSSEDTVGEILLNI